MSVSAALNRDRLRDPARRELSLSESHPPVLFQPGALWSIPFDTLTPAERAANGTADDHSAGVTSRLEG
ncbi:hypothetical protein [Erwinia sp. B116]|uniref:hypothetical protein n=1 Tax=Erwinia sp. B116 TaxID=1561024 RepID=UPI0011AF7F70|nr:hypothetical protein [Erwinia sp. B116]